MTTEDLSIFFDANGIGDSATIGGEVVGGLFERRYVEVAGVEGYYPTFLCASADVSAAVYGTEVVFDSVDYTVAAKRPDERDLTLLVLEAV